MLNENLAGLFYLE